MQVTYPNPFYKAQMFLPSWAMNLKVAKSKKKMSCNISHVALEARGAANKPGTWVCS